MKDLTKNFAFNTKKAKFPIYLKENKNYLNFFN